MRRILALLLVTSMFFGTVLPITAFASSSATPSEIEEGITLQALLSLDDEGDDVIEENPETEEEIPHSDDDSETLDSIVFGEVDDSEDDTTPPESDDSEDSAANCDNPIMPLSGFEDGDSEFFTKIRLTVTDRSGNAMSGVVYGLYKKSNDSLVELLTTNSSGVATSGDVPAADDYYLKEYTTPKGYQPNTGIHAINLSEICAPSRVDVSAVYDPIMGKIKVIKVDGADNPLANVGFYVYRLPTRTKVDTITTGADGVAITTDLPYGDYEIYEFSAPSGYITGGSSYASISTHDAVVEVKIVNNVASGSLRVYKVGNDDRKIQGAVFAVYKVSGDEWISDITTNTNGYAYANNLLLGSYYAVEKSVPSPYKLNTEKKYFELTAHGQAVNLDFVNEVDGKSGKLKVLKTDDSSNPLSGVVFALYRAWDNKKLAELTTGSDGIAEYSPLIPQDYYLLETKGKTGYNMVTERISFTIDGNGEPVELKVINPKIRIIGKVKVVKKDDAGAPVAGVRFGVYCSKGNLLEELITGSDGTATSGVLNEGSGYYLWELAAAPGYIGSEKKYEFSITENNVIVPVNVTNPRISGGVRVKKTGNDSEPLQGVEFGVYQGDVLVQSITTNKNGVAESGTLYYGDYRLKELATADGYELLDTPIPFSIRTQGIVIEIPVTNPLIMGEITVVKTDEDDTPLSGATFGIYNKSDQLITEITTDGDGEASYTLGKGEYYLKELQAPEGFVRSDKAIDFSIENQGDEIEKVTTNELGVGIIKVIKSSDEGEETESLPLVDVAFDVYNADDEKVGELLTDENGEASMELPLGSYYLVETVTAEGFQLLNGRVSFTLEEHQAMVELPISNQRIPPPEDGGVKIIKKCAATGDLLPNAIFGVFEEGTSEKMGELITDGEGMAVLSLLAGEYYLLETTAPEGYLPFNEKIPLEIVEGEYLEINISNEPMEEEPGQLRLTKSAEDNGERLENAVFAVFSATDDQKIAEVVTDENGFAEISLPEGDYYLVETAAPLGFLPLEEPISFYITSEEALELPILNQRSEEVPGELRIVKCDADSGELLENAVFAVYFAEDDTLAAAITTDENGLAVTNLSEGDYYIVETVAPEGYQPLEESIDFHMDSGESLEIEVENHLVVKPENPGILRIIKSAEDTGSPLVNAVFGIFAAEDDRKLVEVTTGENGVAEIELSEGSYYLVEITAPEGYQPLTEPIPFQIVTDELLELPITNQLWELVPGALRILKIDAETEEPLSGAAFAVHLASDDSQIAQMVTDDNGMAEVQLPEGDYYLLETAAPVGYKAIEQPMSFSIISGKTLEASIPNQATEQLPGALRVMKSDAATGAALSGAAFAIFHAESNQQVAQLTTDENGFAEIQLPVGEYYLVETAAPEGYRLLEQPLSFTISAEKLLEMPVPNQALEGKPGTLRIIKTAEDTGERLADATFAVFLTENRQQVAQITTNADGLAETQLPAGEYYMLEVVAPSGFQMLEEPVNFQIGADMQTEIPLTNKRWTENPGKLRILKTAVDTELRLPNALFTVFRAEDGQAMGQIFTNKEGIAEIELAGGEYYLMENAAPKGYQALKENISFYITSGLMLEMKIPNEPLPPEKPGEPEPAPDIEGILRIIKEDSGTGARLSGAVFSVYKSENDRKIAELTTDENGIAELELAGGAYYLKELAAPEGYAAMEDMRDFSITTEGVMEISILNDPLPPNTTGTVLIVKKAAGTGVPLADTIFGVYAAADGGKITEVTTDDTGQATAQVEPGEYYLMELAAPAPFVPESARIPFQMKAADTTVKVEMSNTQGMGTLLLMKKDTEGNAVSGAVFDLYRPDGKQIAELISGSDGKASYDLPIGKGYYIVEKTAAVGYKLDDREHEFAILHDETTTVEVINEPIMGKVEIYFKHVDGRELVDKQVFDARIGTDYIKWMRENGFENREISGYNLVRTDYPSSLSLIGGTLTVTLWYSTPGSSHPGTDVDRPGGGIEIPKTGGSIPVKTFAMSLLCWIIAAFCTVSLVKGRPRPEAAMAGGGRGAARPSAKTSVKKTTGKPVKRGVTAAQKQRKPQSRK